MRNTHPRFAKELLPNRFGSADTLTAGTGKNLPWKCSICGHKWNSSGNNRIGHDNCPACVNQQLHSEGNNSIASKLPEIANELMINKFGNANSIVYISNQLLPWKCSKCDHEWFAKARWRARGSGCIVCNRGDLHSSKKNCMAKTHPDLAKELLPNDFGDSYNLVAGTNHILPWQCISCDWVWETTGSHRSGDSKTGCPKCTKYGFNPHQPAQYYVHEVINKSGDIVYYKAGISNNWKKRMWSLQSDIPSHLKYNNIEIIYFDFGQDALKLETLLLRIKEIRYPKRKFDGGSELFSENPLIHARNLNLI